MAAASVVSAGQRAGHEQTEAGERDGAEHRAGERHARCGPPKRKPRSEPLDDEHHDLQRLDRRSMAMVLAPSSSGRVSGVEPSRLSTPVWRSNPVAMARLTIAVDMTARASTPGNRKSTGARRCRSGSTSTFEKNARSSTGMANVKQHRLAPAQREQQLDAGLSAQQRARDQAAPRSPPTVVAPSVASRLDGRHLAGDGGQPQEHVLEALATGPQVGERQVALGQPGGERGDVGRASAVRRCGTRPASHSSTAAIERLAERGDVEAGRRAEADLLAAAGGHQLGRRAAGDEPAPVDDHDPVGHLLRLVEVVGGEQHAHAGRAQLADELADELAAGDVDARGRLVEERHLGLADQRERERQPLLLAARHLPPGRALAGG